MLTDSVVVGYNTVMGKVKHMTYDFFAEEWSGECGACGSEMYAPTKSEYLISFSLHTHSKDCLGGW